MFIRLLLSFLLILTVKFASAGHEIPNDLRKKLLGSGTFEDIMKSSKISLHNDEVTPKSRLLSASMFHSKFKQLKPVGKASNTHTNDVNLLKTVKQGADTCYLQTVCQPVPLDDDADPQILLFPRCSEVTRCIGSCCDTGKSCKPTRKEYVFKTVFRLKYIGNSKFAIDKKLSIPMEQHLGCQCRQCQQWEFIRCGKNQVVGPNCDCICRNEIEKASCQGLRQWSEETCSCKCRPMSCSEGAVFNDRNCTCIYQS